MNIQPTDFDLARQLQQPIFNYKEVFSFQNPELFNIILLMMYFAVPSMGPIHFQRISMGKNVTQVKKAFLISATLFLFIKLATSWIPFLLYSINPNLDPSQLVGYILKNYAYTGLRGIIIIGILAMAISSADSFIIFQKRPLSLHRLKRV
jgi:Na+/proline symporter